jgi:hypothetical protein
MGKLRALAFVSLGALAACSTFGSSDSEGDAGVSPDGATDATGGMVDGGADGGADGVVDAAATRCNPAAPFGTPTAVKGAPTVIGAFRLTKDETHAYYDDGNGALFYARLDSFDTIGQSEKLSVSAPDIGGPAGVSLSEDETTAFFEQNFKIWTATKQADGGYGPALKVLDSAGQPYLDERGTGGASVYASHYFPNDAGAYPRTVYRASYTNKMVGPFIDLQLGADSNFSPTPGAPGEGFYLGIERDGGTKQDIYLRATDTRLIRQDALDSVANEFPLFVSHDGCFIYLASNRVTNFENQLFVAARAP